MSCKGLFFKPFTHTVVRKRLDIERTHGMRFQKSLSCPGCEECRPLRDWLFTDRADIPMIKNSTDIYRLITNRHGELTFIKPKKPLVSNRESKVDLVFFSSPIE